MSLQLLDERPISDQSIRADVFLGCVAKMSFEKIKGMERPFALHLISDTAEVLLRQTPEKIEPVFETRMNLLYNEKGGFLALLQWSFAKRKMRRKKPVLSIERNTISELSKIKVTEKQAMACLLLAASSLDFLTQQIQVFELETHLVMRTISEGEAKAQFNQLAE